MNNPIRTCAHYFDDDIGGERPLWALLTIQGEILFITECASCSLDECDTLDERERGALQELCNLMITERTDHSIVTRARMRLR